MDAQDIIDFITKLPESMQQITDMQIVLDAMEDMDANALSEWQATKAYAKLTGHKTACVAKEFLPLLHNALHLMHSGKPKKAMALAIKEDVFLISSALKEALKRPGSAERSFVWQDKTQTTPAIVKRLLSEAPTLVDPAKRHKVMKEVPHYAEIGRTPVFNAPIRRELDAEKVRWDNHVGDCLRMLTTLQLVTEDPESVPEIDPVNLLHHTIATLRALSLWITQFTRVAVDKCLEVDKPGSTPLFAETEVKLWKHKDTLNVRLRGRSPYSSFHQTRSRFGKGHTFRPEEGKGKGEGKGEGFDTPFYTERVAKKKHPSTSYLCRTSWYEAWTLLPHHTSVCRQHGASGKLLETCILPA